MHGDVSDNGIRVIPTSATWVPEPAAADAATSYVASLLSTPGASADEVAHEFRSQVAVIDSGVNTSSATCTACAGLIDFAWIFDIVDDRSGDLSKLDVTLVLRRPSKPQRTQPRLANEVRPLRDRRHERHARPTWARLCRTRAGALPWASRPPSACSLLITAREQARAHAAGRSYQSERGPRRLTTATAGPSAYGDHRSIGPHPRRSRGVRDRRRRSPTSRGLCPWPRPGEPDREIRGRRPL